MSDLPALTGSHATHAEPDAGAPASDAPPRPARRSLGRRIGIIAFSVVAGLTVIALIAAGVVVWTIQRSFPQLDGTVAVAGLDAEVTVHRDALGIPTIVAGDSHDLFHAQGYVHAQDRFWEMDFRRHVTSGRLSELFGASQLPTDTFLRTLGWHHVAEEEVAALDDTTRGYYEAYADGVNAYLADHDGADVSLEYAILGMQNSSYEIEPWTPADSVAWLKAMAWDLRGNVEEETERAILAQTLSPEQIAELYPGYPYDTNPVIVPEITTDAPAPAPGDDPAAVPTASVAWKEVGSVVEAASALLGGVGEGIGSNSWVVSGALTESGLPLLSNDPHLGASLPSVWHQVGLRCRTVSEDCPFDVAGFGFSGVPGVVIGHNAQIAWGFTNLTADVTDLYLEKIDGDAYWRDGALVPLETRTETFRVAGGEDVTLEVRSTVHGPIVSGLTDGFTAVASDPYTGSTDAASPAPTGPAGEYAVALRWTALDPGTTASAIFALNRAQDFAQFRHAATLFDVPAQNLVYADRDGNIGYQAPGRLPLRGAGDGTMPQPGWDSAYDWTGFIPFDDLPVSYNPASGYIVTANNPLVGQDYPYFLGSDFDYGWRAARITDLLERAIAGGKLTADDMSAVQTDQEFWIGKRLVAAYADITLEDADAQRALDLLDSWDAQNTPDSPAAAFANVLWDELAQDLFARRDDPAPLSDQARLFLVVDTLLDEPGSPWWTNDRLDVSGQSEMLQRAATDAYARLVALQGDNPDAWNWGDLHAITLTSDTFGSSGIAPIEWLFNRGPFPVGGGSAVVDATGWYLGDGSFATHTVPSMRMTVDLSDIDASRWNHLTGTSGHAFHPNYDDQFADWQQQRQTPWLFTREKVADAATNTLVLTPAS
ncbi:penicillin acylase family protein [Microbacterium aurum]|jgi:penicillin amidase|uniref:penicillin acylase family protein n=1 Tax=Microbacterium aurum TaxID=36805 RepID=UPI000A073265|nr:penicillin acylase family protein [Microbacterium aurum]MBM7826263.1 penicillin amidase [Microbacterium aurum]